MKDHSYLIRMIILTSFAIISLIIYYQRLSKNSFEFSTHLYKKTINWNYENNKHLILLHSVEIDLLSFTAFSMLEDSIIRLPVSSKEIIYLKNIKKKNNLLDIKCIRCHK